MPIRPARAITAATVVAIATLVSAPAAAEPAGPAPPPLPADAPVPPGDGKPDKSYTKKNDSCRTLVRPSDVVLENKPWGQIQLRYDDLHAFGFRGEGQLVAVIDTGVRADHPYFGGRVVAGADYVATTAAGPGLEDCDGHGTEVAGIIAANPGDPRIGFIGIAPEARILSIRQSSAHYQAELPDGRTVPAGSLASLANAIVDAANRGATVINISIDSCRPAGAGEISVQERLVQSAVRYAVEVRDAVVVASAGNTSQNGCPEDARNGLDPNAPEFIVTPPWFADHVLSVAAVDRLGNPAEFTIFGPWVGVAAPGTEIVSVDPASDGLANVTVESGQARPLQGTSFAAPQVSGLAALIRQKYPDLSALQVVDRIRRTAARPATPTGRDNFIGFGLIDPVTALTAYLPSEHGVPAAEAEQVLINVPPPHSPDRSPLVVAISASAGAVVALALTLFTLHAIRRKRQQGAAVTTR